MKIIIDTKEDSKEHIRKAVLFLQTIVDSNNVEPITPDFNPEPAEGAFGMFDTPQQSGDSSQESGDSSMESGDSSLESGEKEPFNMNDLIEY